MRIFVDKETNLIYADYVSKEIKLSHPKGDFHVQIEIKP